MEIQSAKFNPYLALINPVYECIKPFYSSDRGANLALDYGGMCKLVIDDFEKQAFLQELPSAEVSQVKYALAALVDEAISTSLWDLRYQWMGRPLQLQYFSEALAGEGFFNRLAELRQAGAQYLNVLEVYLVCLQLGFAGMYGINGRERLAALTVELQNYLAMIRGSKDKKLSVRIAGTNNFAGKLGGKLPFWVVASVTALLLLLIYICYSVAVDHRANSALENINTAVRART
jgi:type VI secretion system protein ImpK